MATMKCAVYARFSSERQNARSIEDQVRQCREYAARQGWEVAEGHIYCDEALSGRSMERPAVQAMLAAMARVPREFDCILVDDTSRVSRHQADALRFYERLAFAGVRLVAVSQGVDSQSEQADLILGVHGLIDSVYSKELAQKTHRGMAGAAVRGTATGGRCFGYRTERDATPGNAEEGDERAALRWTIHAPEAEIVRRIFALSAEGMSLKKIARTLNAEGVATPRAYRGRRHASWSAAALSVMLHNERYVGEVVWNKTRNVRNPETGRRVQRLRPANEWMRREEPRLRIVERGVWDRVQARLLQMRTTYCLRARSSHYLLSGILECGMCGSKMTLVSGGRGRTSVSKYGCPLAERGVCSMQVRVAREPLERRLVDALLTRLSEPAVLARIERRVRVAARERVGKGHVDERAALLRRIERLADLIAVGDHSPALLRKLREMEQAAASMRPAAARVPSGAAVEIGALRQALATKGDALKGVLARMARVTIGGEESGRTASCAVYVGAGGES